jgi:hypothetical protein
MTKRKPKPQPCEKWIPANKLPANVDYGWSDRVLVCQFKPGDRRPTLLLASYDFQRGQWRLASGVIENVTHYQPLPDFPREYRV